MQNLSREVLASDHQVDAIRRRLSAKRQKSYLGDTVLGAIDGCVTTFAVVAGASGGGLPASVALLLGTANLVADGFSMAVSNYQRAKSERELIEKARQTEERHIDLIPEGEKEEVRQIFQQKGFQEPLLSEVVSLITANRKLWVETMLIEELGLSLEGPEPKKAALATFLAFVFVGAIPLLPLLITSSSNASGSFVKSSILTAVTFFSIGLLKGRILARSLFRSALETLLVGSGAALLAYLIGSWLRGIVGIL